jgi:hypothetical protein
MRSTRSCACRELPGLWARKDGVAIYENPNPTAPGGRMVLVTPYRKIKMLHFMPFLLHNDSGLGLKQDSDTNCIE